VSHLLCVLVMCRRCDGFAVARGASALAFAASKQRCPVFQCWDKVAQVLDIRYCVTPAPCGFPRQFLSVTFSPPGLPLCVRHGGVTD
jgi:hypothetical protein